jgi:hypothetical protein
VESIGLPTRVCMECQQRRSACGAPGRSGQPNGTPSSKKALGHSRVSGKNFVGRWVKEDFAFMQRVAQGRPPDQMWAAHVDFWQKAIEDYSNECLLMGKLAAGVTTKAAATAQCATQEASAEVFPSLKAA